MRITEKQLRQIIREELLREAVPATTDPAVMQQYKQDYVGQGPLSKTAELYGLLIGLRGETDPEVLGMALSGMMGEHVYLPTGEKIPRVTGVVEVEMVTPDDDYGGVTEPFPVAIFTTDLDGTVGLFTLKKVLPGNSKLVFEQSRLDMSQKTFPKMLLTVDEVLARLETFKDMAKALQSIEADAADGKGAVFMAAKMKMPEIRPGKYLGARASDDALEDIQRMRPENSSEFFTSY